MAPRGRGPPLTPSQAFLQTHRAYAARGVLAVLETIEDAGTLEELRRQVEALPKAGFSRTLIEEAFREFSRVESDPAVTDALRAAMMELAISNSYSGMESHGALAYATLDPDRLYRTYPQLENPDVGIRGLLPPEVLSSLGYPTVVQGGFKGLFIPMGRGADLRSQAPPAISGVISKMGEDILERPSDWRRIVESAPRRLRRQLTSDELGSAAGLKIIAETARSALTIVLEWEAIKRMHKLLSAEKIHPRDVAHPEGWRNEGGGFLTSGAVRAFLIQAKVWAEDAVNEMFTDPFYRPLIEANGGYLNVELGYRELPPFEPASSALMDQLVESLTTATGHLAVLRHQRRPDLTPPFLASILKTSSGLPQRSLAKPLNRFGVQVNIDGQTYDASLPISLDEREELGWPDDYCYDGEGFVNWLIESHKLGPRYCPLLKVKLKDGTDPYLVLAELILKIETLMGYPFGEPVDSSPAAIHF